MAFAVILAKGHALMYYNVFGFHNSSPVKPVNFQLYLGVRDYKSVVVATKWAECLKQVFHNEYKHICSTLFRIITALMAFASLVKLLQS